MTTTKTVIFGSGEITNLLIKDLTLSGQKVLCVTDNSFGQVDYLAHNNLETATYREVIDKKLEVNTAVYSWRDLKKINQENQAILGWLESEMFQANKSFHLSSASVYKHSNEPQNEASDIVDTNEKVLLEKFLDNLARKKRILHTNLRVSNVYGSGISHGFIGSLFHSIKTGSEIQLFQNLNITRDYIHVEDVVYAIGILLKINNYRECINISTGIGTQLSQILEEFSHKGFNFGNRTYLSNQSKVREISILDCSLLGSLINWQPQKLSSVLNKLLMAI